MHNDARNCDANDFSHSRKNGQTRQFNESKSIAAVYHQLRPWIFHFRYNWTDDCIPGCSMFCWFLISKRVNRRNYHVVGRRGYLGCVRAWNIWCWWAQTRLWGLINSDNGAGRGGAADTCFSELHGRRFIEINRLRINDEMYYRQLMEWTKKKIRVRLEKFMTTFLGVGWGRFIIRVSNIMITKCH